MRGDAVAGMWAAGAPRRPAVPPFGRVASALLGLAGSLALAGLAVASYLTVVHFADQPIVCSSIGDCELVNSSKYADVGGLPVATMGLGAYAAMLLLVVAAAIRREPLLVVGAWAVALASFAFSLYLTYIELFVLDAICVWCVGSAVIVTALLATLSSVAWTLRDRVFGEIDGEDSAPQ
jgi:uncharacterized membrane protein